MKEGKRVSKEGSNKIFINRKTKKKGAERKKSRDSMSKAESTRYNTDTYGSSSVSAGNKKYYNPKEIYNLLRKIWKN